MVQFFITKIQGLGDLRFPFPRSETMPLFCSIVRRVQDQVIVELLENINAYIKVKVHGLPRCSLAMLPKP